MGTDAREQSMNTNGIKLLLFDFDGTLVNTTPLILRSFRATWREACGFVLDDSEYIKTFGLLLPKAMRMLLEEAIIEGRIARPHDLEIFLGAKVAELMRVYREFNLQWHDDMIEPVEGVEEMLRELKDRRLRLGLVSSKMRQGLDRGLNIFRLAEMFDVIVAGDDCENHKPHPEPLLRAIAKAEVSHREAIYVGDSPHDIAAGFAARMLTAAVAWGPFPRTDLERMEPDLFLDRPQDLTAIFNR
jgi:pyrophosphatase PpaX